MSAVTCTPSASSSEKNPSISTMSLSTRCAQIGHRDRGGVALPFHVLTNTSAAYVDHAQDQPRHASDYQHRLGRDEDGIHGPRQG